MPTYKSKCIRVTVISIHNEVHKENAIIAKICDENKTICGVLFWRCVAPKFFLSMRLAYDVIDTIRIVYECKCVSFSL